MEEQLNTLAIRSQRGCSEAKRELLRWFLPKLYALSESIWYKINNQCHFEAYCIDLFERAIKNYSADRGNFSTLVKYMLRKARLKYLCDRERNSKVRYIRYQDDLVANTDEKEIPYESVDELAIIEDSLLVKEKIALLAKGDSRKKAILLAWSDGFYNDSALSELLAQLFGGKPESHRQAIKRFRSFCQASLAEIA
jgi:hypothetical protein